MEPSLACINLANPALSDLHCHLDFAGNACELAQQAQARGMRAFSTTVDPRAYENTRRELSPWPCVRVGLGLHPWWLADSRCGDEEVRLFEELAGTTRFIGEVGLDFAPRRAGTFERQEAAFRQLMGCCSDGGRLISVHAVRAATTALDALEETGALKGNAVVLHWFSGTSEELARAVRLGCWFSIGSRMLATKRGRAYARAIPHSRLLLETDLPDDPVPALAFETWHNDLETAFSLLAEARGIQDPAALSKLRETLDTNSQRAWAIAGAH